MMKDKKKTKTDDTRKGSKGKEVEEKPTKRNWKAGERDDVCTNGNKKSEENSRNRGMKAEQRKTEAKREKK